MEANWLMPAHRTQVRLNRCQMTPASQWKQKKDRVKQTTEAKEKTSGARTTAIRAKESASMILEGSSETASSQIIYAFYVAASGCKKELGTVERQDVRFTDVEELVMSCVGEGR